MEQDGRPTADGDVSSSAESGSWDQVVDTAPPIAGESLAATIAALADPATRSPIPDTCPFFRTIDETGAATPPIEAVDVRNRCVAIGEPTPQSARQQQLVCLTTGHNNCPRYLRGSLVAADTLAPPRDTRAPSTPVIVSALLLVAATAMSVGFLLVRGSFDLPAAASGPSAVAVAPSPTAAEPSPIATTASESSAAPRTSVPGSEPPAASPNPTPAPPTPAATPAPTEAPTPASTAPPTPRPTSDRYVLLVPCPNVKDCWIYTVRAGDNLRSIVNYFGVGYGEVLAMNPSITNPTSIHAGDAIRMPPPTR